MSHACRVKMACAGAERVIACEWNPAAVQALRRGLALNGCAARCDVREGDCRRVAPQARAFP